MDSLLPYFEHELSLFNSHAKEFAKKYPKIAGRLLMAHDTVDDPHIERLIQAFALISARINKKLDDSYADFTESLLQVVYPDYAKPFPSVSIAQFQLGVQANAMSEVKTVPSHTAFATPKIKGTACKFQSTQQVNLFPLEVADVVFEMGQEVYDAKHGYLNGCITIKFLGLNSNFNYELLKQHAIDLYIDEDASQGTSLWDLLYCDVKQSLIKGVNTVKLKRSPFELMGFESQYSLLPDNKVSNAASALLKEYFYFPEKFNFLRLDIGQLCSDLVLSAAGFEVKCYFKFDKKNTIKLKNLQQLTCRSIKLFCTPVVNLFEVSAKPIQINHTQVYYDLVPDTHALYKHEVYSVKQVIESRQEDSRLIQREYHPFYALNHYEQEHDGQYYHVKRDKNLAEFKQGYDYQIMFVDKLHANKNAEVSNIQSNNHHPNSHNVSINESSQGKSSISAKLLCTNRDLPSQVLFGQTKGDLFAEGLSGFSHLTLLQQPTRTVRFSYTGDERWRLISLISLNILSLSTQNASLIKEYLSLYDITQSAANKKIIDGISRISTSIVARRLQRDPQPGFVRGTQIKIFIDTKQYAGVSIRQFAHLLSYVFGFHASLNSFAEVVILDAISQEEIYRCHPRSGHGRLI